MNSPYRGAMRILILLCLILVGLQVFLIPRVNFNWDEFNELSHLFANESGFHIGVFRQGLHYLVWPLKYLPWYETSILILARYLTYFAAVIPVLFLIYRIARIFASPLSGWLAVYACLSFGIFLEASLQYRTDPFATALFLGSLYHFLKNPNGKRQWLLPGLLLGLSMFLNPKAIFQVFLFSGCIGYYLLYGPQRGSWLVRLLLFNLTAGLSFIWLQGFHIWFYDLSWEAVTSHFQSTANVGFGNTIGWNYKWTFLKNIFMSNPIGSLFLLWGWAMSIAEALKHWKTPRPSTLVLLVSLGHLATIAVHQGVHKYYAVNLIPTFSWFVAVPIHRLYLWLSEGEKFGGATPRIMGYVSLCFAFLMMIGIAFRIPFLLRDTTENQKFQNHVFNQLFPEAKAYGDGFGLLARKNNIVQLLTGRRLFLYQQKGEAILPPSKEDPFPAFFIFSRRMPLRALISKDLEFLRRHYISFCGERLWVHGKQFKAQTLNQPQAFEILTSGPFTLQGNLESLFIDGEPAHANMVLKKGEHQILGHSGSGDIQLCYGNAPPETRLKSVRIPDSPPSGTINIPETARWYVATSDQNYAIRGAVDQQPLAQLLPFEKQLSIFLQSGSHTYTNPSGHRIQLHRLGPLFYREAHE